MSSLRFRLLAVLTLTLVACVASQSAGARSTGVPASALARLAALSEQAHVRGAPVSAGAARRANARSAKTRSRVASPSNFTDIGANLGSGYTYSAEWVDYDADGRLDVSTVGCSDSECSSYGVRLFRNNGDGSFSENTTSGLPEFWQGVVHWTDYNSDGYLDVLVSAVFDLPVFDVSLVATLDIDNRLYKNNGDGTFTENTSADLGGVFPVFYGDRGINSIDYNNDGRLDIAITGIDSAILVTTGVPVSLFVTKLFRNNGDGSFSEVANSGLPDGVYAVSDWSDYDLDGYVDVLFNGCTDLECLTYTYTLYRNNGDGTFSENTTAGLPDLGGGWNLWGDFTGDALPDLVLNGSEAPALLKAMPYPTAVTKLYRNNGNGTFSEVTNAGLPDSGDVQIVSGDFNSDGRLDVLLNGYDNSSDSYVTEIYNNNDDGSFGLDTSAGLPSTFAWLAPGDYDTDGRLDLLIWALDGFGNPAAAYRNESPVTGAFPAPPTDLKARLSGDRQVTFYWDRSASENPSSGLSYNLRVGTKRDGSDIVSPMSTAGGSRLLVGAGNTEGKTFATITLPGSGAYHWSVQTVSAGFLGSTFARAETFVLPPGITIKRPAAIKFCGITRSTTVRGHLGRVLPLATTVVLQRRFGSRSSWKTLAQTETNALGRYTFSKVGKGSKRSFWVRVVGNPEGSSQLVSGSRRVVVKRAAVCRKAKK